MYKTVHHVLVGTSIVRNASRQLKSLESCARAAPGTPDDEQCHPSRLDTGILDELKSMVSGSPYLLSAELNAMRPWLEAAPSIRGNLIHRVTLYVSDSGASRLAATILEWYLQSVGVGDVEPVIVRGFGLPSRFVEGLLAFQQEVSSRLRRDSSEGYCVLMNLTGGFKMESAVGLLVALPYASAVYYVHESFRKTVVLPVSVFMNKEWAKRIFERIRTVPRPVGGVTGYIIEGGDEILDCWASSLQPLGLVERFQGGYRLSPELVNLIRVVTGG